MSPATEDLVFANGSVFHPSIRETKIPFADVVKAAYLARVSLSATGYYATPGIHWDRAAGRGKPFHYFACGAAVTEVEVDGFTGMHRVLRVDILHDAGDSINEGVNRGQIEGGFVQGMGWLTTEELEVGRPGPVAHALAGHLQNPVRRRHAADFQRDAAQERDTKECDSRQQSRGRTAVDAGDFRARGDSRRGGGVWSGERRSRARRARHLRGDLVCDSETQRRADSQWKRWRNPRRLRNNHAGTILSLSENQDHARAPKCWPA